MVHNPRLLLLDEPTAGVDPKARRDFWEQIHLLAARGLTFLIATHYMDEADRCHRLAFIAGGKLLTHGTAAGVIAQSGLTTWAVAGPDLFNLAARLRQRPGVEQAAAFGARLHVSGGNPAALEQAIAPYRVPPYQWSQVESGLEEVFIHLMDRASGPLPP
jgi:ABC-2 type transport system ATP-binding protein